MSTILIIDDSLIVRSSLNDQCKSKGYNTFKADSGENGIKILHEKSVDLIITDILMPGMSGEELIQYVKSTPSLAHIPVLVISGQSSQDTVVRCIEFGAEDFLSKPFVPEILHARIRSCLERAELRKMEIKMREAKAAEKCSLEMSGAICHNFSQPLTSAVCNLNTLEKFLERLMSVFNHVRDSMSPEVRAFCDGLAKDFVMKNRSNVMIDDLFKGLQETAKDTSRSLKQISSLIFDLQTIVRPSSTCYLENVDIIDFAQSKKHTVLIACADDDCLSRYIEQTAAMGYNVLSALNPKEGLMQARFNSPHLIIIAPCACTPDNFMEILRLKSMNELNVPVMVILNNNQHISNIRFSETVDRFFSRYETNDNSVFENHIKELIDSYN